MTGRKTTNAAPSTGAAASIATAGIFRIVGLRVAGQHAALLAADRHDLPVGLVEVEARRNLVPPLCCCCFSCCPPLSLS